MSSGLALALSLLAMADPPDPKSRQEGDWRAALVDRVMAAPVTPRLNFDRRITFEDDDEIVPAVAGEDDDEAPPPARRFRLGRENFDRWVFGDRTDLKKRRDWLAQRLEARIERLELTGRVNAAEVEKLRLAGKGDTKRYFDRVEGWRLQFDGVRSDQVRGHAFLARDLRPISAEFESGPFGDPTSLFAKTLRKIEGTRKAADRRD